MKKRSFIILLSIIFILFALIFADQFFNFKKGSTSDERVILYYSEECKYCVEVQEFISKNNLTTKLNIDKRDIKNEKNLKSLRAYVKKCNIKDNFIGLPFAWSGKDCLIGSAQIISFLKLTTENSQ